MRVVACDDMQVLADAFIREAKSCCEKCKMPGETFEYYSFSNPNEMLVSHERMVFDLAILDIAMPVLDGFQCAELMRGYNPDIEIIFVTSHSEYMEESFDCGAFWFVEKSLDWKELNKALIKLLSGERKAPYAKLRGDKGKYINDIVYYTAARNKAIYHFGDGREKEEYTTLTKIEADYPYCFRVNKSTVVNIYFIKKANNNYITLFNGEKIKLARGKAAELKSYLEQYISNPEMFSADQAPAGLPPAPSDIWE